MDFYQRVGDTTACEREQILSTFLDCKTSSSREGSTRASRTRAKEKEAQAAAEALKKQKAEVAAHHIGKPSFAELCRPVLHGPYPFVSLKTALHPIDGVILKTSNEAMVWQTYCPAGMTILEGRSYLEGQSYLELRLTGHKLQWPRLLRELASTNLNFSLEAVTTWLHNLLCKPDLLKDRNYGAKYTGLSKTKEGSKLWRKLD